MRTTICRSLLVVLGLAASASPARANAVVAFPVGSVIIPSSASFQSDCGAVSMYGLVYDVLRANTWLAANGYGAITINYAIADSTPTAWSATGKQSPNRCKPSNLHTAPAPSADASWNDGCDFQLTGVAPVVKLVKNTATSSANDSAITTYSTISKTTVFPQYTNLALTTATTVGYLGGPMVISNTANGKLLGSDAATFLKLVDGTLIANDSAGNAIDFTPFNAPMPGSTGACTFGTDNYVNLHRAQVAFNASIFKQFSSTPPRLALLNSGNGPPPPPIFSLKSNPNGASSSGTTATYTTTAAHGYVVGQTVVVSGVGRSGYNGTLVITAVPSSTTFQATVSQSGLRNSGGGSVTIPFVAETTGTISGGILPTYLNNAGLTFPGAQGCPTGGVNTASSTLCPIGGNPGQIYDTFDFADLVNNKLVIADAGIPRYAMIWTPHWDTSATGTTAPSTVEATALGYVRSFLDGQTGLFAECASITSFEGTYQGGSAAREGSTTASGGMQLETCVNNAGTCAASTTQFGLARNATTAPSGLLKNCTDVTTLAGSSCAYYGYPQDPFGQISDYLFSPQSGETMNWLPNGATTAMYKPGVLPLVSGVSSLVKANLASSALARSSGMIVADWFTRSVKDNAPGKGNLAYLGGHDLTSQVAGSRLVLQTLLQLGSSVVSTPPTTIEISRASPIVANLNSGTSIVQGTFESVTPAPVVPVIALPADVASWTFPYLQGHLRATAASTITSAAKFGAGTVLFDAAGGIPAVRNGGCSTPFSGTCRTVFTTTTASTTGVTRNPPLVFFQDSNADLLGNLMAPGLGAVGNPQWKMMVEKVLAGAPDGFGGLIPQLGGVDRSTVAVIEPSPVASTTRPTMAYFGATDGMLHAVCASVTLPACDTLGRELWAFMPRTQLPFVRLNTTRIDGSPHVSDVFGDFTNSGVKSFHTILTFQTGSGVAVAGSTPAVFALDITNPTNPSVVWEDTAPAAPGAYELGAGLAMAGGPVSTGQTVTNLAYAETNNGGTGGVGVVVAGINIETGAKLWQFNYAYPAPHVGTDIPVPASGLPGGVVAVDKATQGFTTDVVFGDLYGNLWEVDPSTGVSRYPTSKPLFQFSTDYHPIGAMPAIYANGGRQYAVVVPGGFDDPADTTWGSAAQRAVSISLNTPAANATLSESSGSPNLPFTLALGAGERGFSQAFVMGGQLFITTDTADVNASGYGTGSQTGHLYAYSIGSGASSTVVVAGGAGSATVVGGVGGSVFTSSSNRQQEIATPQDGSSGTNVDGQAKGLVSRKLWLRTI